MPIPDHLLDAMKAGISDITDISVPPENWYEKYNMENSPIGYAELGETDIPDFWYRMQYQLNWDMYVDMLEKGENV